MRVVGVRGRSGRESRRWCLPQVRRTRGLDFAGDLERIGHISGRKVQERAERGPVRRGGVHAVEEDHVPVRIELHVRRCALHDDDGSALGALACARAQAPPVPGEHRVDEEAGDDAVCPPRRGSAD